MPKAPSPSQPPTIQKEYLFLLLLIALSTWGLIRWCGPSIRASLQEKKHNKTIQSTKTNHNNLNTSSPAPSNEKIGKKDER